MCDILCFNNKLSFLKSATTLIVPFFLGIANDGEAHSEGIVFFKDSNVYQSYNFLALLQLLFRLSRNSVSTCMNRFTIRI
jgi:hypothetical protein